MNSLHHIRNHPLNFVSERLMTFMHAPPEHVAHVLNAAALYSGLCSAGGRPMWSTMNLRNPSPIMELNGHLNKLGLVEFANACRVQISNCARYVVDEFSPQASELLPFIRSEDATMVYTHYYTPFWNAMCSACEDLGIPFGLHVQIFYYKPGLPFHFDNWRNARYAVLNARFITVSQEADRRCLSSELGIPSSRIGILPKCVPPVARRTAFTESTRLSLRARFPSLCQSLRSSKRKIVYVGRLEPIKNIDWFLEKCMPHLVGRGQRSQDFELIIVGRGRCEDRVRQLCACYSNACFLGETLSYTDTLCLLSQSDLLLFPSGYDYSPRLPIEAISMDVPVLLGDFHFNERYKPFSIVIREGSMGRTTLDYTAQEVYYGIPDPNAMVDAISQFLQNPVTARRPSHNIAYQSLLEECAPEYGGNALLKIIEHSMKGAHTE